MFKVRTKPVSNEADFVMNVQMTDKQTGEFLDLTGTDPDPLVWNFEAWPVNGRWDRPFLKGSTTTGEVRVAGLGMLQVSFPVGTMATLPPGSYRMSLIVKQGQITRAIYLGLLPVVGREQYYSGYSRA